MVNLSRVTLFGIRYNSPWTQVVLLGIVTFCSVGMFSAISNLGAGGTENVQLSDTANGVLYGCFAIMGFFAGSVNNLLGPRLTLSIGTTGYSLYVGALWAYQVHGTQWFLILAGAILGITAALLWAAQGAIMMAYPLEKDKGRSFSVFWTIFQLGTLVGSAIALGIQYNSDLPTVSTGVYLAFMIIMLTAIATSWLLLPPHSVIRGDGTVVEIEDAISPRKEFKEFIMLFKDWKMVALFPMFFASNYFYAYQGAITAPLFNGRTRALVALLTGLGSMVGSIVIGLVCDRLPFKRRARTLWGCGVTTFFICLVWGAGIGFQSTFTREDTVPGGLVLGVPVPWDFTQQVAIGPIILLMSYYIVDAMFQGLAYTTMGTQSNSPFKLARMAGYYKGVQSAGAAISFGVDAAKAPYLVEILLAFCLLLVSLPLCAFVLYKTPETNYGLEKVTHIEDIQADRIGGAAVPAGHHLHQNDVESPQEKLIDGQVSHDAPNKEAVEKQVSRSLDLDHDPVVSNDHEVVKQL